MLEGVQMNLAELVSAARAGVSDHDAEARVGGDDQRQHHAAGDRRDEPRQADRSRRNDPSQQKEPFQADAGQGDLDGGDQEKPTGQERRDRRHRQTPGPGQRGPTEPQSEQQERELADQLGVEIIEVDLEAFRRVLAPGHEKADGQEGHGYQ